MACATRVEVEPALLRAHLGIIDDLQQEIAELAGQCRPVFALDGVGDLVGLLDRVGGDGGEGLLDVPRAAPLRVAQPAHHVQQLVDAALAASQQAALLWPVRLRAARGRRSVRRTGKLPSAKTMSSSASAPSAASRGITSPIGAATDDRVAALKDARMAQRLELAGSGSRKRRARSMAAPIPCA